MSMFVWEQSGESGEPGETGFSSFGNGVSSPGAIGMLLLCSATTSRTGSVGSSSKEREFIRVFCFIMRSTSTVMLEDLDGFLMNDKDSGTLSSSPENKLLPGNAGSAPNPTACPSNCCPHGLLLLWACSEARAAVELVWSQVSSFNRPASGMLHADSCLSTLVKTSVAVAGCCSPEAAPAGGTTSPLVSWPPSWEALLFLGEGTYGIYAIRVCVFLIRRVVLADAVQMCSDLAAVIRRTQAGQKGEEGFSSRLGAPDGGKGMGAMGRWGDEAMFELCCVQATTPEPRRRCCRAAVSPKRVCRACGSSKRRSTVVGDKDMSVVPARCGGMT